MFATIAGAPTRASATFTASGWVARDPAVTAVVGRVIDNTNLPVPGVTLSIEGTGLSSRADADGLFRIVGVPAGSRHLHVDASTVSRTGTWPNLSFLMNIVPGRDNSLPSPIYLLPLDTDNAVFVSEHQGGVLVLPEYPGYSLEIEAGSVTFPDGSREGLISVTPVHGDKVPMVPNFGQQPRFIVSIQPANSVFDPPAKMTVPNLDAMSPGQVTELYSFDHDLESFVRIGLATVANDGLTVTSNPGVGILKAGWHATGDPQNTGTPHNCLDCETCDGQTQACVPDPMQNGNPCQNDPCLACDNGACLATQTAIGIGNPPDNPVPADADFATNFSFLASDTIAATSALTGRGDPSQIQWSVTATRGGVMNETPANREGPTFSFEPDPPAHPAYNRGTGCANPGSGSCARSQALSFALEVSFCTSSDQHTATQDQIDIIRQEYENHGINVPARGDFNTPVDPGDFPVREILQNTAYSVVLGTPWDLAQSVRDEFNHASGTINS